MKNIFIKYFWQKDFQTKERLWKFASAVLKFDELCKEKTRSLDLFEQGRWKLKFYIKQSFRTIFKRSKSLNLAWWFSSYIIIVLASKHRHVKFILFLGYLICNLTLTLPAWTFLILNNLSGGGGVIYLESVK